MNRSIQTQPKCDRWLYLFATRDYADLVERRLKGIALNTGLLLISVEASLPQALEDVTRRKVLYAIILTSQNEVHRSVTLNILHGSPQGKF